MLNYKHHAVAATGRDRESARQRSFDKPLPITSDRASVPTDQEKGRLRLNPEAASSFKNELTVVAYLMTSFFRD
jgi:hypothetical protein